MSAYQSTLGPVLERLKKSPTFAMSLGAKELFHSNFIAFLLESREPNMAPLQIGLRGLFGCPYQPGDENWCGVFRELHGLDLVLVPVKKVEPSNCVSVEAGSGSFELIQERCAVVELKLKAIPTLEQLERYKSKLVKGVSYKLNDDDVEPVKGRIQIPQEASDRRRLLHVGSNLDLSKGFEGGEAVRWQAVGWDDVVRIVEAFVACPSSKGLGEGMWAVIADYAQNLKGVLEVVSHTKEFVNGADEFCYAEFVKLLTAFPALKQARLQDLTGKRAYSDIVDKVRGKVKAAVILELLFTLGTPGLTASIEFSPRLDKDEETKIRLGAQLQGMRYRHFISAPSSWGGLEKYVASNAKQLEDWFNCDDHRSSLGSFQCLVPGKRSHAVAVFRAKDGSTNLKKFGKNDFLYSDIDLSKSQATMNSVIEAIASSMDFAERMASNLQESA